MLSGNFIPSSHMHFFSDEGGDDEANNNDHPAGAEAGDYALPDDIGERIGEGEDHNPATLGNE